MSTPEILVSLVVGAAVLYGAYRLWKRRDRKPGTNYGGGNGGPKGPPTQPK